MKNIKMSLLIFGLLAAVWALAPVRSQAAQRAATQVETYSSSEMDSAPAVTDYDRESDSTSMSGSTAALPGHVEERDHVETYERSDMDSAPIQRGYDSEREYREPVPVPANPPVEREYDGGVVVAPDPPRESPGVSVDVPLFHFNAR